MPLRIVDLAFGEELDSKVNRPVSPFVKVICNESACESRGVERVGYPRDRLK